VKATAPIHTQAVETIIEQSSQLECLVSNATNGIDHSQFELKRALRIILDAMYDLESLTNLSEVQP
jgi:hypothetical protein